MGSTNATYSLDSSGGTTVGGVHVCIVFMLYHNHICVFGFLQTLVDSRGSGVGL